MKLPQLQVIEGAKALRQPWLDLPATVGARSPFDKNSPCCFRVSGQDVAKAASKGRKQPAFAFWSIIMGTAPPVNNVFARGRDHAETGLIRLDHAHACFSGIRRPLGEDDDGASYVVYVLKPRFFYAYKASLACVAEKTDVPEDLVFAAYARLDEPPTGGSTLIVGTLTHWDFVEADAKDRLLPVGFGARYVKQLW